MAKTRKPAVEFSPRADATLLRATAELRPRQAPEGRKLKQWQAVAKRVAEEVSGEKGGDLSTLGCMGRFKSLLAAARREPKDKWPGDEEMHKLLEEALVEEGPQAVTSRATVQARRKASKGISTPLIASVETTRVSAMLNALAKQIPSLALVDALGLPLAAPVAAPTTSVTQSQQHTTEKKAEAVAKTHHKKRSKEETETGESPVKKHKHRHHTDASKERAKTPTKKSVASPKLAKPLVLRLRRTSQPGDEKEGQQWQFVEPEVKKTPRRHASEARKSPAKPPPSDVPLKAIEVVPSPVALETVSEAQPDPKPSAAGKAQPTKAVIKATSKSRPAPRAQAPKKATATLSVSTQPRAAPVLISPCSAASTPSPSVGLNADTVSTLDDRGNQHHVFGDAMLVGELSRAVTMERMWLNMAKPTQPSAPIQVEADAEPQDKGTTTDESSREEIEELKRMVNSMASALATSQQEQAELRNVIATSQLSSSTVDQLQLVQQVQQLTDTLNQTHRERNVLHQGFMALQQQVAQLKMAEIKLGREVASLWTELTALKGTQVLHTHTFEDDAKERCAIEANIKEAARRQETAFQRFADDEKRQRQELFEHIERGRAKQKSNAQELEESVVWFQEEMKRELDDVRDTVERDVAVFDDLLDSVQEEHKAQLEALNTKISVLTKSNKPHPSTQARDTTADIQELREELEKERSDRKHEYKALLRSIQRIMATE